LRLATSNYRWEGRGGSRAARIQSSERFAARDEQLSVEGEGWESGADSGRFATGDKQLSVEGEVWESGGAARQAKLKSDLRLVTSNYRTEGEEERDFGGEPGKLSLIKLNDKIGLDYVS